MDDRPNNTSDTSTTYNSGSNGYGDNINNVLAPGWEKSFDPQLGKSFYYHPEKKLKTWKFVSAGSRVKEYSTDIVSYKQEQQQQQQQQLPFSKVERFKGDEYFDTSNGSASSSGSSTLDPGWSICTDDKSGMKFYYNQEKQKLTRKKKLAKNSRNKGITGNTANRKKDNQQSDRLLSSSQQQRKEQGYGHGQDYSYIHNPNQSNDQDQPSLPMLSSVEGQRMFMQQHILQFGQNPSSWESAKSENKKRTMTEEFDGLMDPSRGGRKKAEEKVLSKAEKEEEQKATEEAGGEYIDGRLVPIGMELESLDKDIYSLLMVNEFFSLTALFCLSIAGLQLMIAIFVFQSYIDTDEFPLGNFFMLPEGVDVLVTIGQFILVILIAANYGGIDLAQVIEDLSNGYDKNAEIKNPEITHSRWLMANILHFVVAFTIQLATFQEIMGVTIFYKLATVILSFGFIAEIDNLAYAVASYGLCSKAIQVQISQIQDIKMLKSKYYTLSRRVGESVITLFFGSLFFWFVYNQSTSKYSPQQIQIQFGDEYDSFLPLHTGLYKVKSTMARRAIYEDRGGRFRFGYCKKDHHWSFYEIDSVEEVVENTVEQVRACKNWIVKSPKNMFYDIMKSEPSKWIIKIKYEPGLTDLTSKIDLFVLKVNECTNKCRKGQGKCNENKDCICEPGFYGMNCQMKKPCETLVVDLRSTQFPEVQKKEGAVELPSTANFTHLVLENPDGSIGITFRPVYAYISDDYTYIIVFTGRRWILSFQNDYYNAVRYDSYYDRSTFVPIFISSPMDVDTDTNQLTPIRLEWFQVRSTSKEVTEKSYQPRDKAIGTSLTCAYCDEFFFPCLSQGVCGSSSTEMANTRACDCTSEFGGGVGSRCELVPDCNSKKYPDTKCFHGGTCNEETGRCENCKSDKDNYYYGKLCNNGGERGAMNAFLLPTLSPSTFVSNSTTSVDGSNLISTGSSPYYYTTKYRACERTTAYNNTNRESDYGAAKKRRCLKLCSEGACWYTINPNEACPLEGNPNTNCTV